MCFKLFLYYQILPQISRKYQKLVLSHFYCTEELIYKAEIETQT